VAGPFMLCPIPAA